MAGADYGASYLYQMREHQQRELDRWEAHRTALSDLISTRIAQTSDPVQRANLYSLAMGLHEARPGKFDPKLIQSINEQLAVAPEYSKAMDAAEGAQRPKPPANPVPTGTPVRPTTPYVPPVGARPSVPQTQSSSLTQPISPVTAPAAQSGVNPIQGGAQIQVPPTAPPPAASASPIPGLMDVAGALEHVAPAMRQAASPFVSNVAELERQKQYYQFQKDMAKQGIEQMKAEGVWDKLAPWQQAAYMAQASGLQSVNMPFSAINPIRTDSVPGSSAPEGQLDYFDHPIDPQGFYDVQRSKVAGQKDVWVPTAKSNAFLTDAGGNIVSVSRYGKPGAPTGAVTPSLAAPTKITDVTGQQSWQSPARAAVGAAPIPGAGINPAMAGTATTTTQLPSGGSVSERKRTAPGAPGTPSVPGAPGAPSKTTALPARVPPFNPSNRVDNIVAAIGRDEANWKMATNAADKFQITNRMAQLGIDTNNVTGSMRERAANAHLILDHLSDVQKVIDEADKAGELGVVATRWNDWLTGRLGVDPTKGQVFAKLSSNLAFLSTAVAMAHGGLRGGGSPQMVEHWEKALFATDPATLRQKLNQAKSWMEGYAKLVPRRGEEWLKALPGATAGSTVESVVDKLVQKYGGKK